MAEQTGGAVAPTDSRVEPGAPATAANSEAGVAQQEQPRRPSYIMRVNLIVLVLVLLASGLVPLDDVLFAAFASAYFIAIAKLVYPSPTKEQPPRIFPRNHRLLGPYIAFAGLMAIPFPVAYILGSFVKGDQAATQLAAPHLFLIACQVLTEILVASTSTPVSLPVRALVPISYNTRRLFTLAAWVRLEFGRAAAVSPQWTLFGRGLAAANMALWAYNLLGFLVPVYLPLVMKKHYELERLAKEHRS